MLRHTSRRNRTNVLKRFLCPIWYVFPDTLSLYLIRRHQIFQSSAFSNSLVFCIPISAIAAAVLFGLNGGASTFNSFSFSHLTSQFSSKGQRCWIGRCMNDFPDLIGTARITLSLPQYNLSTIPIFHFLRLRSSFFIDTTSPMEIFIFFTLCFMLWRSLNACRYSAFHRFHMDSLHFLIYLLHFFISVCPSSST